MKLAYDKENQSRKAQSNKDECSGFISERHRGLVLRGLVSNREVFRYIQEALYKKHKSQ